MITVRLQSSAPELRPAVLSVLKPAAVFVPSNFKAPGHVWVACATLDGARRIFRDAQEANVQLTLIELPTHSKALSTLRQGTANGYTGRFFKAQSAMAGSLYRFNRTYLAWGTETGYDYFRDIPDVKAVNKYARRKQVGTAEGEANLARFDCLREPVRQRLLIWQEIAGRMPMPYNPYTSLVTNEWLSWSIGHGSEPFMPWRTFSTASCPQLAMFGFNQLAPTAHNYERLSLF